MCCPLLHSNWAGSVTCWIDSITSGSDAVKLQRLSLKGFAASTFLHYGILHVEPRQHSRRNDTQATTWRGLHEQEPRPRSAYSALLPASSPSLTCQLCECGYNGPSSHLPQWISTVYSTLIMIRNNKLLLQASKFWSGCYTTRDSWNDRRRNLLPVRLERDSVIAREFTQVLLKLSEKLLISLSLVQRYKWVDVCKFLPCNRLKSNGGEDTYTYTYYYSN